MSSPFGIFGILLIFLVIIGRASSTSMEVLWVNGHLNFPIPEIVRQSFLGGGDGGMTKHRFVIPQNYEMAAIKEMLDENSLGSHAFFLKSKLLVGSRSSFTPEHCKDEPDNNNNNNIPSGAIPTSPPPELSSANFDHIIQRYSIDPNSSVARVIKVMLERCEKKKNLINGKFQACVTSLQAMASLVAESLREGNPNLITGISLPGLQGAPKGSYEFQGFSALNDDRFLLCHKLTVPFGAFFCHQPSNSTAYSITLHGVDSGVHYDALAACHSSTGRWNPDYVAFRVLGVKPGVPVCHLLQAHDAIWFSNGG
ncbi:hypothetical protein DM860_004416 [Cuscuta australis]|uniref:BURP domain-containing protein n=1 Tax=Cuscuta australis TaxID=267555 RepID=A0A328E7E1_9ASTE|nr:hypothetical protein DM860_004416 [Cuscuta australis]